MALKVIAVLLQVVVVSCVVSSLLSRKDWLQGSPLGPQLTGAKISVEAGRAGSSNGLNVPVGGFLLN